MAAPRLHIAVTQINPHPEPGKNPQENETQKKSKEIITKTEVTNSWIDDSEMD